MDDAASVTTMSVTSSDEGNLESMQALAAKENRRVKYSKTLMFGVLLLAAAGSSYATFVITRNNERKEFENTVINNAKEIISVSRITADTAIKADESFSMSATAFGKATGDNWPFVIQPDFPARAKQLGTISGTTFAIVNPIVKGEQLDEWNEYSYSNRDQVDYGANTTAYVWEYDYGDLEAREPSDPNDYGGTVIPQWQVWPSFFVSSHNFNSWTWPEFAPQAREVLRTQRTVISPFYLLRGTVRGFIMTPIFRDNERKEEIVAFLYTSFVWARLFTNVLPNPGESMVAIVRDTCGNSASFFIDGPNVTRQSIEDFHDTRTDYLKVKANFDVLEVPIADTNYCRQYLEIFPSGEFYDSYQTNEPVIYMFVVLSIFALTMGVFLLYDCFVQQRQLKVMLSATRTNAIVSSLFPEQVRDRLLQSGATRGVSPPPKTTWRDRLWRRHPARAQNKKESGGKPTVEKISSQLKDTNSTLLSTKPIADLFPSCTVLFADIGNFTAWSSVRQPDQVFTLLEQVYGAFDAIAKKRKIFKVETIGDCYVAAAGVPEQRSDHAVVMTRFAKLCRFKMIAIVRQLEVLLGPGTGDLGMRFGLHSGPVTAGVLRGEKSRFQLFGDTVNTAARIESTGRINHVHLSQSTAKLLIENGKNSWIEKRQELVVAKGKGKMETWWLSLGVESPKDPATSFRSLPNQILLEGSESSLNEPDHMLAEATEEDSVSRLVDWNVSTLQALLRKIAAMRVKGNVVSDHAALSTAAIVTEPGKTVLDEVQEIIHLPDKPREYLQDPDAVELPDAVLTQLRDFVQKIAGMYRKNSFHCYEHAAHVTQSVIKLLARVVTSEDNIDYANLEYKKSHENAGLHEFSYGITSDPLVQFSCAFSAMIHDVEHAGVSNATLVKEGTRLAKLYNNKSVAEQNSVDVAWQLLMQPMYADLRACIYADQKELERFRSLVVNSVMATDIVDKELGAARKARWAKAFDKSSDASECGLESSMKATNRKATIVIEHIIQASDVSHTMQHWHVYIKWNERLFHELYKAHLDGRGTFDPSMGHAWYKGEIGFFDFYIIPLAKKLKDCGVFGVASDEYLNYALANREEWIEKGHQVVKGYMAKYRASNDD